MRLLQIFKRLPLRTRLLILGIIGIIIFVALRQTPPPPVSPQKDFKVLVKKISSSPKMNDITLNGHTEASAKLQIKSAIIGHVKEIPTQSGHLVQEGQVLLRLDIDNREHNLATAKAKKDQRQLEHSATVKLMEKSFEARLHGTKTLAELKQAEAEYHQLNLELQRTTIAAPFKGVIENVHVDLGEYVETGTPLMRLVCLDPLKIVGYITENDYSHLQIGAEAHIEIASLHSPLTGKITYISPIAEEKTRTFMVWIETENKDQKIPEGLTVTAKIPLHSLNAHQLPASLLTLNAEGALGIKILNSENVVVFNPVTLLASDTNSVWVVGLPETAIVITRGQEFIIPGQSAVPVFEEELPASNLKNTP